MISIKLDYAEIAGIEKAVAESAEVAMEALHMDVISEQTMPFDVGNMQNTETFVDAKDNEAHLVTGSPQARRLYYHPEYNFQRGKNTNAGAGWLDPYISGGKKDFLRDSYSKILADRIGGKK